LIRAKCYRQVACNNFITVQKIDLLNDHNPETARTNSKKVAANQSGLLSQLILKTTSLKRQQSHKTKSQDTSEITWRLVTARWKPEYPKFTWWFWKHLKPANHRTITQAITNWNTWRKWEFPSHMTIYGYKNRLIWTEMQTLDWKISLSVFVSRAEVKSLSVIGLWAHYRQWSGKRNWLVPPSCQWPRLRRCPTLGIALTSDNDQE